MKLVYPKDYNRSRMKNKSLIHYAIEYVECMNISKTALQQINYVRLKKGVLLPCEVVGAGSKIQTECYRNINELSPMK